MCSCQDDDDEEQNKADNSSPDENIHHIFRQAKSTWNEKQGKFLARVAQISDVCSFASDSKAALLNVKCVPGTCALHLQQHRGGGLHPAVGAPCAAVEAGVLRLHACQVQADTEGVGAAQPAPVSEAVGHRASFRLPARPDDAPGLVVVRHLLQSHLVDGAVTLALTDECRVAVLLCYQLGVCMDQVFGLRAIASSSLFFFFLLFLFWWVICREQDLYVANESNQGD